MLRTGYFAASGAGPKAIEYLGNQTISGASGSSIELFANIPSECDFVVLAFNCRVGGSNRSWSQSGCWVGSTANTTTAAGALFTGGGRPHVGFQYLANPPTGNQTCRITTSGSWTSNGSALTAHYLKGVDLANPIADFSTLQQSNGTKNIYTTLTAIDNSIVLANTGDAWNSRSYYGSATNATLAASHEISGGNTTVAHLYRVNPVANVAVQYGATYTGANSYNAAAGIVVRGA